MTTPPETAALQEEDPRTLRERELDIAREVAHAFLFNTHPLEIYRRALARVMPLVDATFSSVFLRDPQDPTLLKLECAQNWPQSSARFLSDLRIRVGRGPTGRAVAEASPVEVQNVYADPELREWWEPARELGFAAMISLPLAGQDRPVGALSFYFGSARQFSDEERQLLSLVADQLAVIVKRTQLMEALRRANEQLRVQNEELARRVRQVEESRRLKDEFLGNVSHELRTPLTSILGYTYLLASGQAGKVNEQQTAALERIDAAGTVLVRLITDLIELTQLKLGRAELTVAVEDAVALAQRAVDAAGPAPAEITFELMPPVEPLSVTTDAEKALKILENLVDNAFKFTNQGKVTLTVRAGDGDEGAVEWCVGDTGIGIRPEDQETIFDEFHQVDGSSTRLYGGTGLGLALSRRLARLLGGEIRVKSEYEVGSTFTLRLPRHPAHHLPESSSRGA